LKYVLLALLNALLMAVGQTFWKLGMKDRDIINIFDIFTALTSPFVIAGLFVYGLTMFLWLYVLNKAELSYVYPIQSMAFVFVLIISSVLFREALTINRIIGVLVICMGAYIVSLR
jgi:uncharacterized membrane protein